jgi:hypothetical protein
VTNTPQKRKKYTLTQLIDACDPCAPISAEHHAWLDMAPVGREFGGPEYKKLVDDVAESEKSEK